MSAVVPARFRYPSCPITSGLGWSLEERRSISSGCSPASIVSARGVKTGGVSSKFGSPTVIGMVSRAVRPSGSSALRPSVTSKVTDASPR